jgi:predicted P-loop ATPase
MAILAVKDAWFTDYMPLNADAKRVIENIRGRWIVEAGELSGMRAADVESLKGMLSRRSDKARMSYDRLTTEWARQCVFAGTTNSEAYLKDTTGNRRFWPVLVDKFDVAALRRDRDQLWAEAASREAMKGASIRLDPKLWAAAGEEQEGRLVADPFVELIEEHLDQFDTGRIASSAVWTILNKCAPTQFDNERMGKAMRELGWRRPNKANQINTGTGDDRKKVKGYVKGDPPWPEVKASRARKG